MKKNISRNALIGLAFLASLFMIYFGVNFLKGVNLLKQQEQYYAVFDDVTGLLISSPVYVKGYQVGLISKISMIEGDPIRFSVAIRMEKDISIPDDSHLEYETDLFGASVATLVLGNSSNLLRPGDTFRGRMMVGLMEGASKLMPSADSILNRMDSLLLSLQKIASHPSWDKSITGMGETMDQLNLSSRSLQRVMTSLERELPKITSDLDDITGDLSKLSNDLSSVDIQQTYREIDEAVSNLKLVSEIFNGRDNSMGFLLNDKRLHDSLNVTIETATKLLEDIRLNPERYLSVKVRLF